MSFIDIKVLKAQQSKAPKIANKGKEIQNGT